MAHSPLLGFWIAIAAMAVAGAVRVILHPREIVEVTGGLGVLIGLTRFAANQRGVACWPPALTAFSPEDAPQPR